MFLVDVHSHILPELDDGSKSVEESIEMLKMLKSQGVTHVIATPHFKMTNPQKSIDDFLEKRRNSYNKLVKGIEYSGLDLPKVILGAEVLLTMDFVEAKDKDKLCIEGTKTMLIELPYYEWQSWMFRMLADICKAEEITPIIAHVDRYVDIVSNDAYGQLFKLNYNIQINADFVDSREAVRRFKKWIKTNKICFIGSDCHGVDFRPPTIDNFKTKIKKIAGDGFLDYVNSRSSVLINQIEEGKK